MHDTTRTLFCLSVRSNPVIEDCSGLRFAPWMAQWEGLDDAQRRAGLAGDGAAARGLWRQVNDFKWLRRQQSPHWRVATADEVAALRPKAPGAGVRLATEAAAAEAGAAADEVEEERKGTEGGGAAAAVHPSGADEGGDESSDDEL